MATRGFGKDFQPLLIAAATKTDWKGSTLVSTAWSSWGLDNSRALSPSSPPIPKNTLIPSGFYPGVAGGGGGRGAGVKGGPGAAL